MVLQEELLKRSGTNDLTLIQQMISSYTFVDYGIVKEVKDKRLTVTLAHKMSGKEVQLTNIEVLHSGTKAFKTMYTLVEGDIVMLVSAKTLVPAIADFTEAIDGARFSYSTPTIKAVPLAPKEAINTLEIKDDGSYELKGEGYSVSVSDTGAVEASCKELSVTADDNISIAGNEIQLNGNSKSLVTYAALNTALTTFLTALTTALTTTPIIGNGSPQPAWTGLPTSIDISAAEATKVKTG